MTPNERHTQEYSRALVEKASVIEVFTPEFGQFLLTLFPGNKSFPKHLLNGFARDTIRRLEGAHRSAFQSLSPEYVIRHIESDSPEKILDLAYRIQASEVLLRRCQEFETNIPVY